MAEEGGCVGDGGGWLRRRVAAPGRMEREGEGGREEGWDGDGTEIERRARAGRTGSSRQEFPPNARDLGAGRQAGRRGECVNIYFSTRGGGG